VSGVVQPGTVSRQTVAPARAMTELPPPLSASRGTDRSDDREALLRLAEVTASTRDLRTILQAVTDVGTLLAGAEFGAFFYNAVDDNGESYRLNVLSGAEAEHFRTMPAVRITPLFEPTFSGRETVRIDDIPTDPRHGAFPPGHLPVRSYLATPVVASSGEVYGALLFGHRETGRFDASVERGIRSVASQAAIALENAKLFEAEQQTRRQAEQAAARLAVLQQLTAALAAAVTENDVLDVLVRDVVAPLGASTVRVYLGNVDDWRLVGWRAVPGSTPMPPPADLPPPILKAMRTGETVARPTTVDPNEMPQLVRGGDCVVRASLCLPLVTQTGVLGAIGLIWTTDREFEGVEIEMLSASTRQIAATLERVRLYEAEREARRQLSASVAQMTAVSQTLQRSLLPRELPVVDEVAVAVRYLPGAQDVEVGGDWYDVVATDTGAIFVIGDVQGHSLQAAALMGQLRTGLHAYLAEGHELDVAVGRANKLLAELDPTVMATCCVAELDVAAGRLRVVRAGHPRPVVRRSDGRVTQVDAAVGVPLGVLSRTTWPVTTVELGAGDRLVLYTDGLVERRGDDIEAGVTRLCDAVAAVPFGDPGRAADVVLGRVGSDLSDDVALLVCDVVGTRARFESATMRLPVGPDVVGRARAFTREILGRWDCVDLVDDATLIVSEMVTNAIRHTDGKSTLKLQRETDRVRITVTDTETRPPAPNMRFEPTATSGRGMHLIDALAAAWGVEPTGSGKSVWAELTVA
jgi:serine phosphatase RsbU (regulator of sigma subunit)/anti-sigma regulatory factor (Ser/Thr protein kinase)